MAIPETRVTRWHVLVVEDDPTQAHALMSLLPTFAVETAATAKDGLERLAREPWIDAILLDLTLPNGKGLALVRAFRESFAEGSILIYTAGELSSEDLINAGACRVFRKAVTSPEELEEALVQAIVFRRANRAASTIELKAAAAQHSIDAVLEKLRASIQDMPAPGLPAQRFRS